MKHAMLVASLLALTPLVHAAPPDANGGAKTEEILIDQARALAGGVTPGDAPGFPVTLSKPGRYRLVGNLTVTNPNETAIDITGGAVTLELDGYSIQGPVVCLPGQTAAAITCAPHSTAAGIRSGNGVPGLVTVRNGHVRGFAYGIQFGTFGSHVEGLGVEHTSSSGISTYAFARVFGNYVNLSGGSGINAFGLIADNVVRTVRFSGISTGAMSQVRNNVVADFAHWGINALQYGNAALQANVIDVPSTANGAFTGGVKIGGNVCNGAVC